MKLRQLYLPQFMTSSKGFTLIELLVVIGVIGVLAAGLVVIINPAGQLGRARDAERKSDLAQIQKALEVYYDDYSKYPDALTDLVSASAKYMEEVPQDPSEKTDYVYFVETNKQLYRLYTHLESSKDLQLCNPDDETENCYNAPQDVCGDGGSACNYGVSSPNTSP